MNQGGVIPASAVAGFHPTLLAQAPACAESRSAEPNILLSTLHVKDPFQLQLKCNFHTQYDLASPKSYGTRHTTYHASRLHSMPQTWNPTCHIGACLHPDCQDQHGSLLGKHNQEEEHNRVQEARTQFRCPWLTPQPPAVPHMQETHRLDASQQPLHKLHIVCKHAWQTYELHSAHDSACISALKTPCIHEAQTWHSDSSNRQTTIAVQGLTEDTIGSPGESACVETGACTGSACNAVCSCAPDPDKCIAASSAGAASGVTNFIKALAAAGDAEVKGTCCRGGLISIGSLPTVPLDTKLMG